MNASKLQDVDADPPPPWSRLPDEVAERLLGPLFMRGGNDGPVFGFRTHDHHDNGSGNVHGGILALLADHALGTRLRGEPGWSRQATVQLDLTYMAPARVGGFIEVQSQLLRATRHLAFIRATLDVGSTSVVSIHGTWKISRDA